MNDDFLVSPMAFFLFSILWTCVASIAAWYGLRRLRVAKQTRELRFWLGTFVLRESEKPHEFRYQLGFLTVWTVTACVFVPMGFLSIVDTLFRMF